MNGIRSLLVGIANLILLALLIVAPVAVFLLVGTAMKQFGGTFNTPAALGAGFVAFVMSLPMAALLAVFLDIREQLVTINGRRRPANFTPAAVASTKPTLAGSTLIDPSPVQLGPVSEMQSRFLKAHDRSITPDQAQELLTAQSEGWYLTRERELKARLSAS